ncbi:protein tyrosine phosphatase [Mucilaginibacter sp. HMF5004]|uniref:low molecular weight protein tyrosine phosphatase family protein n=1 Tax=Mucilaginibacter rivuli TaxID=2857527 RepID=UPI001C5D9442|nr:protein tyrosine phosphatase [Mucilaginibacter rivuli]MBW4888340.1 protein tyrosine phosphatase [Mucilaginibacter rivuli]
MPNLLFICSKNQWRSPTAELLFKNHPNHNARSAGTSGQARIRVSEKLILWADVIFVMERKHRDIIKQRFASAIAGKKLEVLDIEDNYPFNDPELIELLRHALAAYIN